uniref:Cyclin N-terminal domain-containing protein n=1 Tax=Oryza punctata TaxID=4537 RepID=A0A0E0KAB8_ORYPU
MTKPRTRSVARMEAASAAAEEEVAGNPVAAVASEAAAEGPNKPKAGEASREPDAGDGSREPVPDGAQLAVVPYVEDIDRHLRALEAEQTRRPMINYVQEIQGGTINMDMRGILVDWMADVAYVFNLQEETLHLAVSYVDRFLSKNAFSGDNLKLLGTTALFVASKYEEIDPPRVRNFSAVTVNTYTTEQVFEMELDILRFLNFDVGNPTKSSNRKLELMCNYLAELSLLDDYYIRFLPSIVAAACLFVGKFTLNPNTRPWNLSVQRNTDCIHAIHDLQAGRKWSNLKAVRIKYKDDEARAASSIISFFVFGSVSTITPPKNIKVSFLRDLKPRTRSVARMEAAAAAAPAEEEEEEEAGNPDGAEGAAVAPEAAAEGQSEPNAGEASREQDAGQASREPEADGGPREPVADAAQLAVAPYVENIGVFLRSLEAEESRRPMVNYHQEIQGGNINMLMRGKLVDWMAELVHASNLRDNVLYLAVSYVDRFLSRNVISRERLQLLGASALFVASKYEGIRYLSARYFCWSTGYTYTTQQVVAMEADILRFLNYEMGSPTRSRNITLELMCNYLAELSLLDDYNIRFLPSVVAAACLFVGKFTLNPNTRPWNLSVQRNTGYKVSDIEDCIRGIHDLQAGRKWSNFRAIRIKYEDDEFERVSTLASPNTIKPSFLRDLKYVNG